LKAKALRLDWEGLTHLGSALPAIVGLKGGNSLVLLSVNFEDERTPRSVTLRDPNAAAVAPIVFWRLLTDNLLFYKGFGAFAVLCTGMGVIVVFETIFAYLRSYLLLYMTSRVDVRLSEYIFDNLLKLPIDYFERTQIGQTMQESVKWYRRAADAGYAPSQSQLGVILFKGMDIETDLVRGDELIKDSGVGAAVAGKGPAA
jgi:hypothetical protein